MNDGTLVVIGASLAGAKAIAGARGGGFEGRLVLVGDEGRHPYERPPLSKEVLRGDKDPASALVYSDEFYKENQVELIDSRALSLDLSSRTIELGDSTSLTFDRLVLATGSAPRHLSIPGSDLGGIHYLRTLDDSLALQRAIRRSAATSSRIAVIGAGWIGSEVAASARQMGAEVVLIDPSPTPLQRVLGSEIGELFAMLHAEHGVDLRLGSSVTALRGATHVEAVEFDDGRIVEAGLVVVGIGVAPNVELAESAGLEVANGIVVDEHLRTSAEGIYAAGDVASAWHPHYQRHLRVEHWANALNQGLTAGGNAGGRHDTYSRLPYFFSDQYDLGLEYVGHAAPDDSLAVRGDLSDREFIAIWHHEGIVNAAMNVNVWDVVDDNKSMIESGRVVDIDKFTGSDIPLTEI